MRRLLATAVLGLALVGCGRSSEEADSGDGTPDGQAPPAASPGKPSRPGGTVIDAKRPHQGVLNITLNNLDLVRRKREAQEQEVESDR